MKYCPSKYLLAMLLVFNASVLFAADDVGDATKMNVEKVVEMCESQYNENNYPDAEERNNLIDQCIEENTVAQKDGAPE